MGSGRLDHHPGTIYRGRWRYTVTPMRCRWVTDDDGNPLWVELCDDMLHSPIPCDCDQRHRLRGQSWRFAQHGARQLFEAPDTRKVHYGNYRMGRWNERGLCGAPTGSLLTDDPSEVTCERCKRTKHWRMWVTNPLADLALGGWNGLAG